MLTLSFKGTDTKLLTVLKQKGPAIRQVLMSRLNILMLQLQRYIVTEKLSGQILKRRTGILAGSIHTVPAAERGTQITGGVQYGGGPAFYGPILESGSAAHEIFAVKARALRFVTGGKIVFAKSVSHPGIPAKPFMLPSLEENMADIRTQLQTAIDEAMSE